MTPAVIIATLALLFTVTSFWWLHARTGRVRASDVTAYAGYLKNGHLTVRIPVLLYNSGARTRVVEELRLTCPTWATHEGNWQTFAATLKPTEDESDFATPYAIDGRKTSSKFVTFTFDYSGHLPEPKPTAMTPRAWQNYVQNRIWPTCSRNDRLSYTRSVHTVTTIAPSSPPRRSATQQHCHAPAG